MSKVVDVPSYLKKVFKITENSIGTTCYRGQSCSHWKLEPSVMRGLKPDAENKIISELLLEAPEEFGADKSMFDKLVRAQHYGLPTRLVDVSFNPLVALYFACEDKKHLETEGVVHIFDFSARRVKYADSDTVSLICNLAQQSDSEREILEAEGKKYKNPNNDFSDYSEFQELDATTRLMHFVRAEKAYFQNCVKPNDLSRYYLVHPKKNNKRVVAQSGAFIAAGLLHYKGVSLSKGFDVKTIKINKDAKSVITEQLKAININSKTMFPEIENVSKFIKEKWVQTSEGTPCLTF